MVSMWAGLMAVRTVKLSVVRMVDEKEVKSAVEKVVPKVA